MGRSPGIRNGLRLRRGTAPAAALLSPSEAPGRPAKGNDVIDLASDLSDLSLDLPSSPKALLPLDEPWRVVDDDLFTKALLQAQPMAGEYHPHYDHHHHHHHHHAHEFEHFLLALSPGMDR
eukprot:NODE_3266_length_468_cov_61.849642_g2843_i0.p1 GENE.NODE_3266_length_468_cov_61.849642_g2843_i0~~NODE_3266_length_468_cov_61.849642_g2843_i0.p1  ORF type:complete len:121 (+),score=34.69 NODE_3266_length_468_cov_61.849642_g2843_i0:33-395(+)